jgi:hypothetical protein
MEASPITSTTVIQLGLRVLATGHDIMQAGENGARRGDGG